MATGFEILHLNGHERQCDIEQRNGKCPKVNRMLPFVCIYLQKALSWIVFGVVRVRTGLHGSVLATDMSSGSCALWLWLWL